MHRKPFNLFIISGPSGVGKNTLIDRLSKMMPAKRIITTTTRKMRRGESQKHPYHFVSEETFQQGIARGEFVEYAKGENGNLYGVTQSELSNMIASDKIGIWELEWQGVISAKKLYPQIKAIFITAESIQTFEKRIRRRQPDASDTFIQERMAYAKEWLKHTDIYDYTVINRENKLDAAVEEVKTIIEKELEKSGADTA